ncbi:hypothetical protein [Microtetraspora malaysiensis]|uniref:hypothetical protein n=1 Tax=Microtetraspora malaysiensis TaxID=161358 RepID=UPI003D936A11
MTGPEHYREGERSAQQAEVLFGEYVTAHDEDGNTPNVELIRRQAEHCREMGVLHATLALAAATALNDHEHAADDGVSVGGMPIGDYKAWREAAGVQPEKDGDR